MSKLAKKSSSTSFEVDISHRITPLRMLYIVILTYISSFTKFLEIISYLVSGKRCELTKMDNTTCIDFYISQGMAPLRMLYMVSLTSIFKVT